MQTCSIVDRCHCASELCSTISIVCNSCCADAGTRLKHECKVEFVSTLCLVLTCDYLVRSRAEVLAYLLCTVCVLELNACDTLLDVEVAYIVCNTLVNSVVVVCNEQRTEVHECTVTTACTYNVRRTAPESLLVELEFLGAYTAEYHTAKLTVTQWQCILHPWVAYTCCLGRCCVPQCIWVLWRE